MIDENIYDLRMNRINIIDSRYKVNQSWLFESIESSLARQKSILDLISTI
jgi:hypothetical protein